ncbi:MAG: ABC transporter ATP-binding protein, partial [Lachnospiraceae bacterium]|nr:ABC transporter ATP-binding protein [Lachnospiraceae bacterium]
SHDRYFINQTATRILDLVNNTFVNYIGNYDYYLEKKEILTAAYTSGSNDSTIPAEGTEESVVKLDWQAQKEQQARDRKRQNDLQKTEERIAQLEERDMELDLFISKPEVFTDVAKCLELTTEKAMIADELTILYETWETLA